MAAIKNLAQTKGAGSKKGARRPEEGQEGREGRPGDHGQGTHARQPAGAVQARREGRRPIPDRQPAADRGPAESSPRARSDAGRGRRAIHEQFRAYRATLRSDQRHLLERFELIDVARKVVGVGSVGTRAYIALLQGRDQQDPLFLQVKEATTSVLEDHLPKSRFKQPGERVVQGSA